MNFKSGILSFILTGLGQLRNGEPLKGLIFMLGPFILLIISQFGLFDTFTGIIGFLILLLLWKIACIVDAFTTKQGEKKWFNRNWTLFLIFIVWLLLSVSQFSSVIRSISVYATYKVPTSSMNSTLSIGDIFMSKKVKSTEVKRGETSIFIYPGGYLDENTTYLKRCVGVSGDIIEILGGQLFVNKVKENPLPSYQYQYTVYGNEGLDFSFLKNFGIEEFHREIGYSSFQVFCTEEEAIELGKHDYCSKIILDYDTEPNPAIWPYSSLLGWSVDNYGPIKIPYKGMTVQLSDSVKAIYSTIIEEEGGDLSSQVYTFTKDYFFMLGDNRKRSADSRFFGLVPGDNLLAKPLYILWSEELTKIGDEIK